MTTQSDNDEDQDMSSKTSTPAQNFTPLHVKKRVPQQICFSKLCPSMDLIALGLGSRETVPTVVTAADASENIATDPSSIDACLSVSNMILVHRTISWEKIFSVNRSDLEGVLSTDPPHVFDLESKISSDGQKNGLNKRGDEARLEDDNPNLALSTSLTWSPDGRTITIGLATGRILLYDIESSMINAGASPTPIQCICTPLNHSLVDTTSFIGHTSQESREFKSKPSVPSPVVTRSMTRSMTAARRKRLMRMVGKTPEDETSVSDHKRNNEESDNVIESITDLGWKASSIVALRWQRFVPRHEEWSIAEEEEDEELCWNMQSYYLDRASHFLPPCAYNQSRISYDQDENTIPARGVSDTVDHSADFDGHVDKYSPKSQTPLSILCVATCANGVHFYLHGRYRILSLPCHPIFCNDKTRISCSSDLTNFVVASQGTPPLVSMYNIPSLGKNRRHLQIISSSYCSIMSHLSQIEAGMKEAAASWSGSLRQLDMKFDQLTVLLSKYGVLTETGSKEEIEKAISIRKELLNYILGGHSNATETSNAMDQFFTHPLMNDQLLQRLERTLEANLAGVEGMIRKKVQAPVRALAFEVSEMHGFVKATNSVLNNDFLDIHGSDTDCPFMMDSKVTMQLNELSKALLVSTELCVSHMVEIRFRLNNLMKWIRGTASQVKAKGTSSDSVQKENARKRRVPDGILQKIICMLSNELKTEKSINNNESRAKRGSTECVLGILFSDNFSKPKIYVPEKGGTLTRECTSLYAEWEASCQIAVELFEQPRSTISKSVVKAQIEVEGYSRDCNTIVSLHNRLGGDREDRLENKSSFKPTVRWQGVDASRFGCRHWTLVANSFFEPGRQMVQISALPDTNYFTENENSYYLTTFIVIPVSYTITDVHFYGDDGCSTLTSEKDLSIKEGKQKIGLLLRSNVDPFVSKTEMLLIDYDDLTYRSKPISRIADKIVIKKFDDNEDIAVSVTWADEIMQGVNTVRAKWRQVSGTNSEADMTMILSGSKGIGATHGSGTIDIYDMEEDEESDEE